MSKQLTIEEINQFNSIEFENYFSNVVESYPTAAKSVSKFIPFDNLNSLLNKFDEYLETIDLSDKERILKLHPDLAGRLADAGQLTKESTAEQASAGLTQLTVIQKSELNKLNEKYMEIFNFPFIICVRQNNKFDAILSGLKKRLLNSRNVELAIGINEVKKICKLRICELVY